MEMNENGTGDRLAGVRETEAALEAILFAAGHPVEYTKIGDALGIAPRDVRTLAEHMRDTKYSAPGSGLHMLTFAESCQLCTREDFLPQIREALGIRRGGNLSPSSLEVLAVVAYNQPVTRAFIDTVRGVDSAYAVGSLIDRDLICQTGRLDAPGRPMLLGTTDKFLRVFGLSDLSELPEAGSVAAAVESLTEQAGPDEAGSDAETSDGAGDGDRPGADTEKA